MKQVKKELVPKLRFPEFEKDGEWDGLTLWSLEPYKY